MMIGICKAARPRLPRGIRELRLMQLSDVGFVSIQTPSYDLIMVFHEGHTVCISIGGQWDIHATTSSIA